LYFKGNSVADEYISKVQLGTINNTTTGTGYSDYTSISTNNKRSFQAQLQSHQHGLEQNIMKLCRMDRLQ
jgi:hypothetical protein